VGHGIGWTAGMFSRTISSATGSFDSVTGVVSETGGDNPPVPNSFSLQLNSNGFDTPLCMGRPFDCYGWQQFIYSNAGAAFAGDAFMQYWLNHFKTTCPTGWTPYGDGCFRDSAHMGVPTHMITDLDRLSLTGQAAAGGMDTIILSDGGSSLYVAANQDDYNPANQVGGLNLASHWESVEFNVFGDCCSSQANFNDGSTLVVRTSVNNGSIIAPSCMSGGFTGETNNLNLVGTPAVEPQGTLPAIVFTESNASGGTPPSCAAVAGLSCREQCQSDFDTCIEESGPPPAPTPAQCRAAFHACNARCGMS
jgi:hypothetical protein